MADSLETSEERRNAFIANVSHELKTPMTTIAGFADGILDGTIPKDQEDKYLVTIADETRRLSRLVRSMLDMSRVESTGEDLTRRREFDISDRIVSTMLSFEARANDKQLDVDLQLPEDPMLVLGDPDAITRVLYNLMDNAVKFAAPGSTLCVSLWKSEGKAYVSVRDHGETIPAGAFLSTLAAGIAGGDGTFFRDAFYEFIHRQDEEAVQKAVLLLGRMGQRKDEHIRTYIAILGNPILRERVLGF